MAQETVAFKITTDVKDSTKDLSALETQMKELNQQVKTGDLAFEDMAKTIDSYKTVALRAGETSPIGREAIKQAAALEDRVGKLQFSIKSLADDGRNMQAAVQVSSAVISSYGAFQGVMAMAGVESEEMMEVLTKMQAAQSLVMFTEQMHNLVRKESVAMLVLQDKWMKIKTATMGLWTTATAGATAATKALRLALAGLGLGAIIAGVALLIENWDKLSKALGIAKTEEQKLTDAYLNNSEERIGQIQKEVGERQKEIDMIIRKRRAEGASEAELAALRGDRTEAAKKMYADEIAAIDGLIAAKEKELKVLVDSAAGAGISIENLEKSSAGYKQLTSEIDSFKNSQAILNDELVKIELERQDLMNKAQTAVVAYLDKKTEAEKKAAEEAKAASEKAKEDQKKTDEEKLAAQQYLEDLKTQLIADAAERRLKEFTLQQERELKAVEEKYGKDSETAEAFRKIQINKKKEFDAKETKLAKEEAAKRLAIDRETEDMRIANMTNGITNELELLQAHRAQKEEMFRVSQEREFADLTEGQLNNESFMKEFYARQEQDLADHHSELDAMRQSEKDLAKKNLDDTIANAKSALQEYAASTGDIYGEYFGQMIGQIEMFRDVLNTEFETTTEAITAYTAVIAEALQSYIAMQAEARAQRLDDTIMEIEESTAKEQSALEGQLQKGLITQEQFDAASVKLRQKADAKMNAEKKKAFEEDKKAKIASATIAGIMGALQAFTGAMSLPPPASFIVGALGAAAVGVMTAANISSISKTKFNGGGGGSGGGSIPSMGSLSASGISNDDISGGGSDNSENRVDASEGSTSTTTHQVVVVESDITAAQQSNNTIAQISQFG